MSKAWWWAAASATGMAIGAFGPWATVFETFTDRGTDEVAGRTVVAAALAAALGLALVRRRPTRWRCLLPFLAGALGVAIAGLNLNDIRSYSDVETAEWGIYLVLVAAGSLSLAALVLAAQIPGSTRGRVLIAGSQATARIRNPWAVFALATVTLGLYYLYWYYQANRELKDFGVGRHPVVSVLAVVPGALLIVPPFVSWWRFIGRLQQAEERAGAPGQVDHGLAIALYLVGIFLLPIELVYVQQHLNGVWLEMPSQPPADPSATMPTYAPEPRTAPEA